MYNLSLSLPMTTTGQTDTDEEDEKEQTKIIRSDQLWAILLAVNATPTPNMKKLIFFLYSIPANNAYVEDVFSEMKHLVNDYRNRMSLNPITAELQIRQNTSLSYSDIYKYFSSRKELMTAISSNKISIYQRWPQGTFFGPALPCCPVLSCPALL